MKFEDVYEVKELIGKGSFAEVKKCVNRKTLQLFAVKEIRYKNSEEREKVEKESEILERLDHMSIVRLEQVFYGEGKVLMVLEYLPGGDLFDGLVSRPYYSEKDACACARQIILALNYLSRKGVIHRDLKPENLLLAEKPSEDRPPIIKLTDFGIAKSIEDGRKVVDDCHGSGSPMYLAPETILEKPVGCAVDMWACGVILYLLLVGYPPFWNERIEFLLLSILQGNYTFPSPYWDSVSELAKDLIKKMLKVNPDERITASEALRNDWIAQGDFVPSLNRRTTLVRLTAFNARRKLKGVVLGLIARKRLNFTPSKNVVRLSRRDSYTPDLQLEQEVQEILSNQEQKEEQRLEKIVEEGNGQNNLLATSPTEYHLSDIKPRRSRQFRSSVYIKVKTGEGKARDRAGRRMADEA